MRRPTQAQGAPLWLELNLWSLIQARNSAICPHPYIEFAHKCSPLCIQWIMVHWIKRETGPSSFASVGSSSTLSIAGHKVNRDAVRGEVILRVVSSNPHQGPFDDSVKAFEIKRVIRESQTSMRLWHVLWICKSTALAIPCPSVQVVNGELLMNCSSL